MLNLWYCDYVSVQRGVFNPCKHTSSKWVSPPTTSCLTWMMLCVDRCWLIDQWSRTGKEFAGMGEAWKWQHEMHRLCSGHLIVFNTWFHFHSLYVNFTLLCRSAHRCDQMCHIFATPPPSGYRCSLQVDGLAASRPPLMNRFPFTYSPEFLAFFFSAVLHILPFPLPIFPTTLHLPCCFSFFSDHFPSSSFYLTPCLPAVISFPVFLDLLHYLLLSLRLLRQP